MKTIKKTLLLCLASLPFLDLAAQDSFSSFVEEGKQWVITLNTDSTFITKNGFKAEIGSISYQMKGDSVIDGRTCKKVFEIPLYTYVDDKGNYILAADTTYLGSVLEVGNRIFLYKSGEKEGTLLYDFNCLKNKECYTVANSYIVKPVNSVTKEDNPWEGTTLPHTCYLVDVQNGDKHFDNVIMEGVGNLYDPFYPPAWISTIGLMSTHWLLYCEIMIEHEHYENIYNDSMFNDVYTRLTNVRKISLNPNKVPIHDLQGRRLAAPPARGVFIQDGRKVIQ